MKQLFLIITFLCVSYNTYAIDCPPSSTCTIPFQTTFVGLSLDGNYQLKVVATISYRLNCDGDFEIKIDNFEGYNGNKSMDFLESFNYLHYSYSSATELVALDFLMNKNAFGIDPNTIPLCSTNNTSKRVFLYTASCGIWTKCSYKLPNPIEKVCDTGWEGGDPHYGVPPSNDQWVDHWKWQSCGDVCCKRTYSICKQDGDIKITQYQKDTDGDCTGQGTFINWKTGLPIPCQVGC